MLILAGMMQRPELFAVAIPVVPVTDLIRFARFTAGARLKSIVADPDNPDQPAARLQAAQGCNNEILLSVAEDGGHYGPSDPVEARRNIAQRFEFIAKHAGLDQELDE